MEGISDKEAEAERCGEHGASGPTDERIAQLAVDSLRYARERDYCGPDYGDGMSNRLLDVLPFESVYLNLAVQELVKRAPVNVRPFLIVETRRNYQGAALFAMANQTAGRLAERSDGWPGPDVDYRAESQRLLAWLRENQCVGYHGFCGGHRHEIQHLNGRKGVPNDPDVVSTSYAVRALLRGATLDRSHADVARTAADFVFEDLNYRDASPGAVINYHLNHPDDTITINAVALGARLFIDLYAYHGDDRFREAAERLLEYVASLQTDAGGWYYREPPDASHLSMDNHHNGFVIEAFQRYADVIDAERFDDTIERGLAFYRTLFEDDGAPRFDEESAYPQDIHASTQGILVFSYAEEFERVRRIVGWTLAHLHAEDGAFYYRKYRYHTKRVVLMRWCQAWMAYAMTEFLRRRHLDRDEA
jgi:hypothetical protein